LTQPACVANGTATIDVPLTNTSPYTIQITMTGPTTKSVTLAPAPSATQTLTLTQGSYTVTGKAINAANVGFIPSTWSLTNGCTYPLWIVPAV
jgi:hypothetical protein